MIKKIKEFFNRKKRMEEMRQNILIAAEVSLGMDKLKEELLVWRDTCKRWERVAISLNDQLMKHEEYIKWLEGAMTEAGFDLYNGTMVKSEKNKIRDRQLN